MMVRWPWQQRRSRTPPALPEDTQTWPSPSEAPLAPPPWAPDAQVAPRRAASVVIDPDATPRTAPVVTPRVAVPVPPPPGAAVAGSPVRPEASSPHAGVGRRAVDPASFPAPAPTAVRYDLPAPEAAVGPRPPLDSPAPDRTIPAAARRSATPALPVESDHTLPTVARRARGSQPAGDDHPRADLPPLGGPTSPAPTLRTLPADLPPLGGPTSPAPTLRTLPADLPPTSGPQPARSASATPPEPATPAEGLATEPRQEAASEPPLIDSDDATRVRRGPTASATGAAAETSLSAETSAGSVTEASPWFADGPVEEPPAPGTVLAADCTAGHPNPPQRVRCGVCGQSVTGATRRVPRPSLGSLRLPDGEYVTLSSPLVIGRNPRPDRATGPGEPRLVPIAHGHVSSSHLEIQLDGWSVLARDLRSRNGTFLRRRGAPPVRLGDRPELLLEGDVLDLGHGVQFTLERLR